MSIFSTVVQVFELIYARVRTAHMQMIARQRLFGGAEYNKNKIVFTYESLTLTYISTIYLHDGNRQMVGKRYHGRLCVTGCFSPQVLRT